MAIIVQSSLRGHFAMTPYPLINKSSPQNITTSLKKNVRVKIIQYIICNYIISGTPDTRLFQRLRGISAKAYAMFIFALAKMSTSVFGESKLLSFKAIHKHNCTYLYTFVPS